MLKVTNNNSFDLKDRYNGVDLRFPAGKTIAVSDDAARHIFGIGEADKTNTLVRLGWMRAENDRETAMSRLNLFSFDVTDPISEGEIIESGPALLEPEADTGQGSAPLQTGAEVDDATDGAFEPSAPPEQATGLPVQGGSGSILDRLAPA